ncbi:MAG: translation elongation factor Ts [Planctomycetaceae bacterium]
MAEITAAAVKALRELTNLPLMDCKQALTEADGDQTKAVEVLKSKFKKVMIKRADNATSEGKILIESKPDGSEAVMIELQCESAPVAGAESFLSLARQCAKQLLNGPGADTPEALLAQAAPDTPGKTLNELYEDVVNSIREKIVLARIARVKGPVGGYVHHDGKQGVLFQAEGAKLSAPVLRDVAMHIAAIKPICTLPDQLPAELVDVERNRLRGEAQKTGKPESIIEKMVEGQLNTFYNEQGVLICQPFAKDDSKRVSQALAESGLKAVGFTRWVLGR